jgi:phosphoglycolate phosphatase
MVGDGLAKLVERAIGPGADFPSLLAAARERYAAHCLDATRPYPGIPALLQALASRGMPMGVLSNKPHAMTLEVVARTFPEDTFVAVAGARESVPIKPDPAGALAMARHIGVPPEATLFVGDTPVDVATARAARMTSVGVGWGFRSAQQLREAGARHLIDAPERLMDLLDAPDV